MTQMNWTKAGVVAISALVYWLLEEPANRYLRSRF